MRVSWACVGVRVYVRVYSHGGRGIVHTTPRPAVPLTMPSCCHIVLVSGMSVAALAIGCSLVFILNLIFVSHADREPFNIKPLLMGYNVVIVSLNFYIMKEVFERTSLVIALLAFSRSLSRVVSFSLSLSLCLCLPVFWRRTHACLCAWHGGAWRVAYCVIIPQPRATTRHDTFTVARMCVCVCMCSLSAFPANPFVPAGTCGVVCWNR